MIINFQGETSLTSSLPLTSPSDVLPNTPTINRCAWNIFNINTQWTFWWVASTWPSEGWPTRVCFKYFHPKWIWPNSNSQFAASTWRSEGWRTRWTGLKTWAAPPFNSVSTSTYRWTRVISNKQHEIIDNDLSLPKHKSQFKQTAWDNHQWFIISKAGEWSTQQSASPSGRTDVTLPSPGC